MTFPNVCWTLFLLLSTSLIFFEFTIYNSNRKAGEVLSRPKIHPEVLPEIYLNTSQGSRVQKLKHILYWTPYFMAEDWQFGFGSKPFRKCPQPNCAVTNKGRAENFDAILFHSFYSSHKVAGRIIQLKGPNQRRRREDQHYVFVAKESPAHDKHKEWKKYSNYFNWTMTYRLKSDIPIIYGWLSLKGKEESSVASSWLTPHHTHPSVVDRLVGLPKNKLAVWLVSNCDTKRDSRREEFVRLLKKHISIDILGECGREIWEFNTAQHKQRFQTLAQNYKFYLSFENSICEDYATEKFFNALKSDIVPVVLGGADYSRLAPPRSYLNVMDFQSAEALAQEMIRLASNDTAYLEYFWWKEHYTVHDMPERREQAMCQLCADLHQGKKGSVYPDLSSWLSDGQCRKGQWN